MTGPITTHRHDNVLVIVSDNPPVNALGAAVRQAVVDRWSWASSARRLRAPV